MATLIDGVLPTRQTRGGVGAGPLMTLRDWAQLQRAPRRAPARAPERPVGTRVTMWAKPVPEVGGGSDHMWVEFDDGRRQYIARGGPDAHGPGLVASAAFGDLNVMGQVDLAERSPDFGQGRRVLDRGFLPNVSAEAAITGAQRHADGVNRRSNRYGWDRNSNSFAADVFEDSTGRRVGDARTPGYRSRLSKGPPRLPLEERARQLPWLLGGVP